MTVFFSTNNDFVGNLLNLEWKMCLYIVDNVSTCRIIYFRYVDTEKRNNSNAIFEYRVGHFGTETRIFRARLEFPGLVHSLNIHTNIYNAPFHLDTDDTDILGLTVRCRVRMKVRVGLWVRVSIHVHV